MKQEDLLRREGLSRLLNLIAATADFIEITAKMEETAETTVQDYGQLLLSEDFVEFVRSKFGTEAVGTLASLLAKMGTLFRDILSEPPDDRLRTAFKLRDIATGSKDFRYP